jgi:hypothetical protein
MKKIDLKPSLLQILYLIIFIILFSFILYTPTLIKGTINITSEFILEENTIEGSLLCILFIMSILILNIYKHDVNKHKGQIDKISNEKKKVEDRLIDSERYIGIINVQIQEIKSIFNSIDKYPETKDDLKKAFIFFGERVIGIVNSKWVLFRIIDMSTQRTSCEQFVTRQGFIYNYPHISNKMIIEKQTIPEFKYVTSNPKNLNILVFCIMPIDLITNDQHLFIQAILNEITKLFIILNSYYYKKEYKMLVDDTAEKK